MFPEAKYTPKILNTWRTSRLGSLYIALVQLADRMPNGHSQLEMVTDVLYSRPTDETFPVYQEILRQIDYYVRTEKFEDAAIFRNVQQQFYLHILA